MLRRYSMLGAILLVVVVPGGCGDDDPARPAPPAAFGFELTVTDQGGAPLPDLKISRTCRLETVAPPAGPAPLVRATPVLSEDPRFLFHPATPNPTGGMTTVKLEFVEFLDGCELTMRLMDWRGEEVSDPFVTRTDNVISSTLGWAPIDRDWNRLPNGVYGVRFTITPRDSSRVVAEFESWFTLFAADDPCRQEIGRTGADGVFATSDQGFFPPLQGRQPQNGRDDDGMPMEPFRFADTVAITATAAGANGWTYWMTRDVVFEDAPMKLEWIFTPDDSSQVKIGHAAPTVGGHPPGIRIERRER